MRKMNKKNKISFMIFVATIVLVLGTISTLIFASEKPAPVNLEVKKDSVIFGDDSTVRNVDKDSKVREEWNGKFYLEKADIGSTPLVLDETGLKLLGNIVEVKEDGSVTDFGKLTENALDETGFFKLADRKYLIVSNQITDKNKLMLNDFVIVNIDKNGSGQLVNQTTNFKTIEPLKLAFGQFEFDIANERLTVKKEQIDLTKINGTTNEYSKLLAEKNAKNGTTNTDNKDQTDTANGQNQTAGTNNNSTSNNGAGGTGTGGGGTGGGGNAPSIKPPSIKDLENLFKPPKENGIDSIKPVARINNLASSINSITVDYFISDLANSIEKAYLEIDDGKAITRLDVNTNQTTYEVQSLKPNTEYKVSLIHVLKKTDALTDTSEVINDVRNVRTKELKTKIVVREITRERIQVNVQMDRDFFIDSGKIQLVSGETVIAEQAIDANKVLLFEGWNTSFNIPEANQTDKEYKIRFADIIYQKEKVEIDKEYFVSNPFETNLISRILNKIFN
ncbi:MAG: hypothetical protein ACRCUP_01145 [Mycoplasmatales bacterium]